MQEAQLRHHLQEIAEQGYTVVQRAIEPAALEEVLAALQRVETALAIEPARNSFEGHHTLRVYNLLALDSAFQQIPVHTQVLPVIEGVLDPGCLISSLSSIHIQPGETAQPIHTDDQVIGLQRPHKAVVCNSMWALTDFTPENGATRLVPGSHRWAETPEYGCDHVSAQSVSLSAGSVLIWHGSLWHGGGANHTDDARIGIAMNYCAGFIRQQENQQLGIPLETVKSFEPRLQELCGFGTYRGLIGHIDKQSPRQCLFGGDPGHRSIWDHDREQ